MKLVDANVLLYAVNADSPHHDASRRWLDRALDGEDTVALTWVALLAFLRLATKVGLFPAPLTPSEAMLQVQEWIAAPAAQLVQPGNDHTRVLTRLTDLVGAGGNLVNDAHLAAIAVSNRADVVTYDSDFGRFGELRWRRPDDLLS